MGKLIHLMFRGGIVSLLLFVLAGAAMALQPGWYHNPDQPGHGVFIHKAPADHFTLSWFTHGPSFERNEDGTTSPLDPQQFWFVSDNLTENLVVPIYSPAGYVGSAVDDIGPPVGAVRVSSTDRGIRVSWRVYIWPRECDGVLQPGPAAPWCHGTYFYELLATE